MNEEQILYVVESIIKSQPDEMYENKIYSVNDGSKGRIDKAILKSKLPQGDWNTPHTEIMVKVDDDVKIVVQNSPMYIYEEYIKMDRNMTQSPLIVDGHLKCSRSVSDFGVQVKEFFLSDDVVFTPVGREDFDVRMVEGRPLLLIVKNPRRNLSFEALKLALYDGLEIRDLCVVKKECKGTIFQGESLSNKTYSAFLCSERSLTYRRVV
ncbi:putative pseudouridylate synthase [Encephalitozoon romaleae SJ-2008]|uniref:tRNA pseudouridine(55) synthase n=1 Tax=Encephalitozoon romaleae (strain SJ-2008) TaxID=1178016 RepID=I6ZJX9_ENCRO|nr:putative pseudouridylate synthase [Encephalitozoon romaleae SJ-2008]AFN83568.1 putative pseudouridylate synthase [Encephalitozoon romaleae SJ-2008]